MPSGPQISKDDNRFPQDWQVATGDITVSTPQFIPITKTLTADNRLSFGTQKKEDEILKSIKAANVSMAEADFHALSMALGMSIAGSQISSKDSTTSTQKAGLKPDLSGVTFDPKTGELSQDPIKLNPSFSSDTTREANYTKTFDSPDAPAAPPTAPDVPAGVQAKLIELLSKSADSHTLDPATLAALTADVKMYMVALEEYNNGDFLAQIGVSNAYAYHPYRVLFSVTVAPGWYSFLKKHEATVDIEFGAYGIYVASAAPAETAQTLDEFASAFEQFSMITELKGAFSAFAFNSSLEAVEASARRLQGVRKNSRTQISFPAHNRIRLQVRPAVVANSAMQELQPTTMLISAVVLVPNSETVAKAFETAKHNEMYTMDLASVEKPAIENSFDAQSVRYCELNYDAWFSPQAALKVKHGITGVGHIYYHAPDKSDRSVLPVSAEARELYGVIPPWPAKKFGFVDNCYGYFLPKAAAGQTVAYVMYNVDNPGGGSVKLTVSTERGASKEFEFPYAGGKLVGFLPVHVDQPDSKTGQIRIMLRASRMSGVDEQAVVQEVVLIRSDEAPKSAGGGAPATPTISIDKSGLTLKPIGIDKLTPDILKTLIGQQITLITPETKAAK